MGRDTTALPLQSPAPWACKPGTWHGEPDTGQEGQQETVGKSRGRIPWARGIGSWRSQGENPGHGHSVISTGIKLARLLQDQIMVHNTAILQDRSVKGIFTTTLRRRNQDTVVTCMCPCRRVDTRKSGIVLVVWLLCKIQYYNLPI